MIYELIINNIKYELSKYKRTLHPHAMSPSLQNIHSKTCFTQERTTQAIVQIKQTNFYTKKRKFWNVQNRFYFFDIRTTKSLSLKNTKIILTFYCNYLCIISKLKLKSKFMYYIIIKV